MYDYLPYVDPFTYKIVPHALATDHKTRLLFRAGDYCILVTSPRVIYEIINYCVVLEAWKRDITNLQQCRANVKKICHEVPLEEVPLYINDESVCHIAAWRLRIAR